MSEDLKKFGRYCLLDRIADGRFSEVFRAKLLDSDGRPFVVKKILPRFNTGEEFRRTFTTEMMNILRLNHPNIAQLYDCGEVDDQHYVAMEYVDGVNLQQTQDRFKKLKQSFPIDLAMFIIEECASGLHYAHNRKEGPILHLDVSPRNILIPYDGIVKIINFGIAKILSTSEATNSGMVTARGHVRYLSPEQLVVGEALDARSDIFSLCIVLWELLTGIKLFSGQNDLEVLKMIETCDVHVVRPSKFNPAVPKELDSIVLTALAKNRDKRYGTAEDFQRALHDFLYDFKPEFSPNDLSYSMSVLFKDDILKDEKPFHSLNEMAKDILFEDQEKNTHSDAQIPDGIIRLDDEQMSAMKKKASRMGIPYDTLVKSVIHRYLSGELVDKETIALAKKIKDVA